LVYAGLHARVQSSGSIFFFYKYNKKYYCKKYYWYKRLFGIFIKLVKIKLILESLDTIFYLAQFKIKLY